MKMIVENERIINENGGVALDILSFPPGIRKTIMANAVKSLEQSGYIVIDNRLRLCSVCHQVPVTDRRKTKCKDCARVELEKRIRKWHKMVYG